jgi:hypothetical protein
MQITGLQKTQPLAAAALMCIAQKHMPCVSTLWQEHAEPCTVQASLPEHQVQGTNSALHANSNTTH